jgi:hypothetical protein
VALVKRHCQRTGTQPLTPILLVAATFSPYLTKKISSLGLKFISLFSLRLFDMEKDVLIKKAIDNIQRLPVTKVKEVSDFAEFLLNKIDDQMITEGIKKISSSSMSFDFLNNDKDLYSIKDLKVKYK